ncbi:MAG: gamma-glutamyltransferase [Gammaproteobacteria bacterium]|nr:gamma-glutamyltransferase [Gammaproteobacteria bacterium]
MKIRRQTLLYTTLLTAVLSIGVEAHEPVIPAATAQAARHYDYQLDVFRPVQSRNGMVASEHHLASQVGLEILQKGGNAVDAAVAMGFALAVTLPNAGNLGGGGFMLLHDAKTGNNHALDFRETAPAAAHRELYLDENNNIIEGESIYSHRSIGVPGSVAGFEHALNNWGSMSLKEVIRPAINLAKKGFPVSQTLAQMLLVQQKQLEKWPATREIFFNGERPLQAGELLIQKDLARSLKLIAKQGAKAFYEGRIARAIVSEMQRHGGLISMQDLADYRAIERLPVTGDYRGFKIVSMPPPSSGGIHLLQMLNILEHFPLHEQGATSAESVRLIAEAAKLAYADRSEFLGDPDFVNIPQRGLISKEYAALLASSIKPGAVRDVANIRPGNPADHESDQTTHFSVIDRQGNMVGVTYTLNLNFGSGIVAEGTGILLNNEMDDFSAKPGVANVYGLIGGEANAIQGGKRPLSSMMPTMVLRDNKPWLVTGSPGGARIITTVLQTLINAMDFGMNPAENAATPRMHHQWQPDVLRIEKGFSPDTLNILEQLGYDIELKASMGRTQTIQIEHDGLHGYSDPRNPDGATLGY